MTYTITIENGHTAHPELDPLYRRHYGEMQARLASQGISIGPYNPRLDQYFVGMDGGWIKTFVVRCDGKPVGYSNIYVTNDMHNGELIAQEDTIYVLPEHRNGVGRRLTKFIIEQLRGMGVKRAHVTTTTDPRVADMLERMGWRRSAQALTYVF